MPGERTDESEARVCLIWDESLGLMTCMSAGHELRRKVHDGYRSSEAAADGLGFMDFDGISFFLSEQASERANE